VETAKSQTSFPLPGYIPQFDGLRAFSILAVFVAHSEFLRALPHAQILEYGRVGVDLFFVLSGFLITGILIDSKRSRHFFRNFYIRRALRIWPLYYLILAISFSLTYFLDREMVKSTDGVWPYFIFYLQNLFPHLNIPYGLEPTWSLAVEEQFYMTWPLLVFLLRKRSLSALLPCLVLISLALRVVGYEHGASLKFIHNFTLCRMDAISLGGLAAIWLRSSSCTITRWRRLSVLCIAVGISGIAIAWIRMHEQSTVVSYTFLAISFVGLLGLSLVCDAERSLLGRILTARWMRFTGKISYGLYLLHMPLFLQWSAYAQRHEILTDFPILRNTFSGLVQFALVFLVATFSWRFIESPLLRLKLRFPSGSKIQESI
jgi:peptidoglycan/LPS O-acetylase OafA/YrhL